MPRVKLAKAGIKDLKKFNWIEYFKYNNSHLLELDFRNSTELTAQEIKLITPSIKAFQLGEGSEGKHLRKAAQRYAFHSGYREYGEIMRWFVVEENRHSQTLKRYMELYGIEPVKKLWIDQVFRSLRKMMGLECEIVVLVTAEMIALSYYTALSKATNSRLLKTICAQMLHDELKHVLLQSDTLHRISKDRNRMINKTCRNIRKMLMEATVFVVWHKYKEVFIEGNYTYKKLRRDSMEYLRESIKIERTGKL